jgi:FkbM family methyltransferase
MGKHWNRLKRSLFRRWKEWRLPSGYERLGTQYGGWWINTHRLGKAPLLIDCGLGLDISFPTQFVQRFPNAQVIGIDPNPRALEYCRAHCPIGMQILDRAFWITNDEPIVFHLPRPPEQLPKGADGISGSLDPSHEYVDGGGRIETRTINLAQLLSDAGRDECAVLKLDIEGAEYALLESLCANGEIRCACQVLVEFHHGVTEHTVIDTQHAVAALAAASFSLIHTEGRNYIFLRSSAN